MYLFWGEIIKITPVNWSTVTNDSKFQKLLPAPLCICGAFVWLFSFLNLEGRLTSTLWISWYFGIKYRGLLNNSFLI